MSSEALKTALLRHGTWRYEHQGIGDVAHYMALHEPQHPADIHIHLLKLMAQHRHPSFIVKGSQT